MKLTKHNCAVALLAAGLLTGCASAPSRGSVNADNARAALEALKAEAGLAAAAPEALRSAESAVRKAEAALSSDGTELDHLGYLAELQVEIARSEGQKALAQADLKALGAEREKLQVDARLKDAETRAREADARARLESERAKAASQSLAQQAATTDAALAALKAQATERGMVLNLGDVLFSSGKTELKAGATGRLDQLADFLKNNPGRKITIEGHTDSIGSDAVNLKVSQDRATSVKAYLMKKGVQPGRISAVGKGESAPVADNNSKAGRQQNRRVEIIFAE